MAVSARVRDTITRYIFSKGHFNNNGVKPAAFMPPNKRPNEVSVYVISDLCEEKIWQLCPDRSDAKSVLARADLTVGTVTEISDMQGGRLKVLIDDKPNRGHANIKHFPTDKSKQRTVATKLANESALKIAS